MTPDELTATRLDMACDYNPDRLKLFMGMSKTVGEFN